MPLVTPCPKDCKVDWVQFHEDFDRVLAHFIDEQDALPTKSTLLEFMEYSHAKKLLQEHNLYAEETA